MDPNNNQISIMKFLLLHSLLWVTIFHILNGYVGDAANGTTITGESNVNVVALKLLAC